MGGRWGHLQKGGGKKAKDHQGLAGWPFSHCLGPSDPQGAAKTGKGMPTSSSSSNQLFPCTWLGLTFQFHLPTFPKRCNLSFKG